MARRGRRQRKKEGVAAKKGALIFGGISVAVVLIAFLIVYFVIRGTVNKAGNDVIWNNVHVENVNVSGMTIEEAKAALEVLNEEHKSVKVKLVVEEVEKEVTLGDLGFKVQNMDELVSKAMSYGKEGSLLTRYRKLKSMEEEKFVLEATYGVDAKLLNTVITESFSDIEGAAVNATIKRENGQFVVTDSKAGIKVDIDASVRAIEERFGANWKYSGTETIKLVTTIDEPDVTKEQLSQIQDVLGTCTTSFVHTNNRGKNVILATSRINGKVLMPGEEMSASDTMLSRNPENGYLTAGSYLNGETVETYGGGVCQVSSTLYGATLYAELEVIERHPHSMTVGYLLPSMDAAIAEGSKDLKFKNNTEYPIYVEGYTVGGQLTFTIYGKETRASNRTVSYEDEILSSNDPGYRFIATSEPVGAILLADKSHVGMKAKLWKVVKENGVEVSRTQVNTSSYGASKGIYHVGIATDNAEAKTLVNNAVATQDEAKIRAAVAQAQALIAASKQPAEDTTKPEVDNQTPNTTPEGGSTEN